MAAEYLQKTMETGSVICYNETTDTTVKEDIV